MLGLTYGLRTNTSNFYRISFFIDYLQSAHLHVNEWGRPWPAWSLFREFDDHNNWWNIFACRLVKVSIDLKDVLFAMCIPISQSQQTLHYSRSRQPITANMKITPSKIAYNLPLRCFVFVPKSVLLLTYDDTLLFISNLVI